MKTTLCGCVKIAINNQSFRGHDFRIVEANDKVMNLIQYIVACNHCNKQWKVEEDYSYHYPLSYWTAVG
ncbi:MAG: hypothetical protein R2822_18215 [Spirosomataceae bacterium]